MDYLIVFNEMLFVLETREYSLYTSVSEGLQSYSSHQLFVITVTGIFEYLSGDPDLSHISQVTGVDGCRSIR